MAGTNQSPDNIDRQATAETALKRRDLIYQLCGQIVSDVAEMEGGIDTAIAFYFDVAKGATTGRFNTWVLGPIALAGKLDILEEVLGDLRSSSVTAGSSQGMISSPSDSMGTLP